VPPARPLPPSNDNAGATRQRATPGACPGHHHQHQHRQRQHRHRTLLLSKAAVRSRLQGELQLASHRLRSQIQRRQLLRRRGLTFAPPGLDLSSLTPELAQFWASLTFEQFIPYFGVGMHSGGGDLHFDRDAWTAAFADGFALSTASVDAILAAEAAVISSGSTFGLRLASLLREHADWPFVVGNLDCGQWLQALRSDTDPAAADVYVTLSRGFALLPPRVARSFPRQQVANYGSALENPEPVEAEIQRLLGRHIIDDWATIAQELGLPPGTPPKMILALGVVFRKGRTRLIIDGCAADSATGRCSPP
jgi:hypothetical protein